MIFKTRLEAVVLKEGSPRRFVCSVAMRNAEAADFHATSTASASISICSSITSSNQTHEIESRQKLLPHPWLKC